MSRAVAGEAGVPFFSISGSEFVEMFVGVWGPAASAISLIRPSGTALASCSWTRSTPWAASAEPASAEAHDEREQTLNPDPRGDGRNSIPIPRSSSSRQTNRPDISGSRLCCGPAALTGASCWIGPTGAAERPSSRCTRGASRWIPRSISPSWHGRLLALPVARYREPRQRGPLFSPPAATSA